MALKMPMSLKGLDFYCCFGHIYLLTNKMVSNAPLNK